MFKPYPSPNPNPWLQILWQNMYFGAASAPGGGVLASDVFAEGARSRVLGFRG